MNNSCCQTTVTNRYFDINVNVSEINVFGEVVIDSVAAIALNQYCK